MYLHQFQVRVRYSETDQMGYVYYGNYTQYYEIGRVEAMRSLGLSYAEIENKLKILMPVVSMNVRYLRPAYYDDLLRLETSIPQMPKENIKFNTKIFNEQNELVNAADIVLCFVDANTKKRLDAPQFLQEKLSSYFD